MESETSERRRTTGIVINTGGNEGVVDQFQLNCGNAALTERAL
tara:strand:- start:236 stop:364 length:129 start_codon:yes stop_codon:yes gene_type:complete